jgi:hypothetical protein
MLKASSNQLLVAVAILFVVHLQGIFGATPINVFELSDAIEAVPGTDPVYMGFLSTGNYDSVAHMFPGRMESKIFDTVSEIEECVFDGTCIAGLTVNRPTHDKLTVFGLGSVKVRGFMFKHIAFAGSSPVQHAMNGAINKLADSNQLRSLKQEYYDDFGIDTVEVRTCAGDASVFAHQNFDKIRNGVITIGRLGPYNWGSLGDYTVEPETGFYPNYSTLLEQELKELLNITVQYKNWPTSQEVMDAVIDGTVDCTDVYWTFPALYEQNGTSVSRRSAFDFSCAVLGTDDLIFVKTVSDGAEGGSDSGLLAWQTIVWIAVLCGVVFSVMLGTLAYMVKKERDGEPLFKSILLDEQSEDQEVAHQVERSDKV